MALRLTLQEAQRLGLALPASVSTVSSRASSRSSRRHGFDPQWAIYQALARHLGTEALCYECKGIVPGRRFRVDIFLPASRIAIEMDGFRYHRSKTAFQKDRERQNMLALHGILVLRYFTRQVIHDLDHVVQQIIQAHQSRC